LPEGGLPLESILIGAAIIIIAAAAFVWYRRRSGGKTSTVTVSEDRLQRAAEMILGDEGLTDEMQDAPASRLLDWAVSAAHRLAEQTADMDEAQAQAFLDERVQDLRRVVRRINKLMGAHANGAGDEIGDTLQKIIEAASQVPVLAPQPPTDLSSAAQQVQSLSAEEALTQILSYVNKE
jgi:hypothetical protein